MEKQQQNYNNLLNLIAWRRGERDGKTSKKNSDQWSGKTKKILRNAETCQGRKMNKIPAQTKDAFKLGSNKWDTLNLEDWQSQAE